MSHYQRHSQHSSKASASTTAQQQQTKQQTTQQAAPPQQQQQAPQRPQQGHPPPATAAAGSGVSSSSWGLEQHYDLLGKIGEGTYGLVYLATAKHDKKQLFAIKKFKTGRVRPTPCVYPQHSCALRRDRHPWPVKQQSCHSF